VNGWESSSLRLSIVVPTFNESQNIRELLRRLEATLGAKGWEIVFVDDDSPDGTSTVVRGVAQVDSRARILRRVGRRGLSTAWTEGMLATSAQPSLSWTPTYSTMSLYCQGCLPRSNRG
jgi:dolichol-phosphate mannosyltransferase